MTVAVPFGVVTADQRRDHQDRHQEGGPDELDGELAAVANLRVRKNSAGTQFLQHMLNLIEGSGVSLTVAADSGNDEIDVTITAEVTQAELDAHINDTTAAHAASAVSYGGGLEGVDADDVEEALDEIGLWQAYVPTLTAATTNPTLGTGSTADGRYMRLGDIVMGWARIVFGSSGENAGSGQYRVSLPVTAAAGGSQPLGQALIFDSGALAERACLARQFGTTAIFMFNVDNNTNVAHNSPWTWAANDAMHIGFFYEAA